MSVPVVKVQDPTLDVVDRIYYAKMGALSATHNQIQAISASDSQVVFNTTTPSVNVGVDRRMYVEYLFTVTSSSPAVAKAEDLPAALFSTNRGLRQFPVASSVESYQLKLNNSTITINMEDMVHALHRYGSSPQERNCYMSGSPSMPDEFWLFDEFNPALPPSRSGAIISGARQPFSEYATNIREASRNLKVWVESVTYKAAPNANEVASFTLRVREPVFIPPLNWSENDVLCLFGIQTIDLIANHSSLQRVLEGTLNNADYTVSLNNTKPLLHLYYVSPQINQEIPRLLHYPFYEIGRYISNGATLTQGNQGMVIGATIPATARGTTNVNNITLHSIPKRLYIYVQQRKGATVERFRQADLWARIDRIRINWDNMAGKLSTAESYDLYRMSVKNGLDMSWAQWSRFCGSVLCIEPATDLGLSPLEASGSRGNYQFSYQIDYTSIRPSQNGLEAPPVSTDYDVYTLAVNEGFLTINDSVVSQDTGVLTERSISEANWAPAGTYNEIKNLYGGSFAGDIWKAVKKGVRGLAEVVKVGAPIVSQVAPLFGAKGQKVGKMADIASGVASGISSKLDGSGRRKGGAIASRKSLADRAMEGY